MFLLCLTKYTRVDLLVGSTEKTSLIVGYIGLRDLEVNCCDEAGKGRDGRAGREVGIGLRSEVFCVPRSKTATVGQ